jgi:hypothetical protein
VVAGYLEADEALEDGPVKERLDEEKSARLKLMQLDQLSQRLSTQFASNALFVFGVWASAAFVYFEIKQSDKLPNFFWSLCAIGVFISYMFISQMVIAFWGLKASRDLRQRLVDTLDLTSDMSPRGRSRSSPKARRSTVS